MAVGVFVVRGRLGVGPSPVVRAAIVVLLSWGWLDWFSGKITHGCFGSRPW